MASPRVLKVGLIGGGGGAFIVWPHQRAINMDGTRQVVCGALHQDPKVAIEEAANWPYPIKGHSSYNQMIYCESRRPKGERIDYVLIVTPNFVHLDPAMKCIRAGIPVFCEKPLTLNLRQAQSLAAAVQQAKIPFGVAHTYLGHWTSRFARAIVRAGLIGDVRFVDSYYTQGWLSERTEDKGVMQAEWRVDPKRAGASGCGGDIGTHALMQLRYVTGLEVTRVSARLETFVERRQLDDHFTTYCELSNGGKALVRASQIYIGHKNNLGTEIVGSKGTLHWEQENSDCLTVYLPGHPDRIYWRGCVNEKCEDGFIERLGVDILKSLGAEPTIPSGHREAFHDAFARLHRFFEADVRRWLAGEPFACDGANYANVADGEVGLRFLTRAVQSSRRHGAWVKM